MMCPAELNNSSMSSAQYMREIWPRLQRNNVNTVLGAVSWDQIEPEEGKFDWTELDGVISDARTHQIHLIVLWFGSFKNGKSNVPELDLVLRVIGSSQYAPSWVKTNAKRFPRAKLQRAGESNTSTANSLSVFYEETCLADAKAFRQMMEHVREVDGSIGTVIMVQVENEVGLLGDSRDRNDAACAAFTSSVPEKLAALFRDSWDDLNDTIQANFKHLAGGIANGATWEATFGNHKHTDELFMAYHYAIYVETIAAAGKSVYQLPLFTNAWLRQIPEEDETEITLATVSGGAAPGVYPSGGPVETVLDIWQVFAPTLDFISPDIYTTDYVKACERYTHRGQPLFIPEQRRDEYGALRLWVAIGRFGAIGTSPFGIDSANPEISHFSSHFALLDKASQSILRAQAERQPMYGFFFDRFEPGHKDPSPSQIVRLGEWNLVIERSFVFGHPAPGYGLIIHTSSDGFLFIGEGYQVTFNSARSGSTYTGLLSFEEKEFIDGQMETLRLLNGDETNQGNSVVMPSADPDYGSGCIPVLIPAKTRMATCRVYALEGYCV